MPDLIEVIKQCRDLAEDFEDFGKGLRGYWPAMERFADSESRGAFHRSIRELGDLSIFLRRYALAVEKTVRDE